MCRQFDSSQHHKQKGLQLVASLSVCGAKAPFLPGAPPPNPRGRSGRLAVTCPEIGLQIEYEQCKLYLGHQWNRN